MSRGQLFSKLGFDPLLGCEIDLVGYDSIKKMQNNSTVDFAWEQRGFFVKVVSVIDTCVFMSVLAL